MPTFFPSDVVLVRYPFTDLEAFKVRPAVAVSEIGNVGTLVPEDFTKVQISLKLWLSL